MLPRRSVLTSVFENLPHSLAFSAKISDMRHVLEMYLEEKLTDPTQIIPGKSFCTSPEDAAWIRRWIDIIRQPDEQDMTPAEFERFIQEQQISDEDYERWHHDPRSDELERFYVATQALINEELEAHPEELDEVFVAIENFVKRWIDLPMEQLGEDVKNGLEQRIGRDVLREYAKRDKELKSLPRESERRRLS